MAQLCLGSARKRLGRWKQLLILPWIHCLSAIRVSPCAMGFAIIMIYLFRDTESECTHVGLPTTSKKIGVRRQTSNAFSAMQCRCSRAKMWSCLSFDYTGCLRCLRNGRMSGSLLQKTFIMSYDFLCADTGNIWDRVLRGDWAMRMQVGG